MVAHHVLMVDFYLEVFVMNVTFLVRHVQRVMYVSLANFSFPVYVGLHVRMVVQTMIRLETEFVNHAITLASLVSEILQLNV